MKDLVFRLATADDAAVCAPLIYSAGPEIYDYIFTVGDKKAEDYIAAEFVAGHGFMGHLVHMVAEYQGRVVAVGAFYGRDKLAGMNRATAREIVRFYPPSLLFKVVQGARHSKSIVNKPPGKDMHIANLGVVPEFYGQGVGTALLQHMAEQARAQGYKTMSLGVACNNGRAEQLYRRLGFYMVEQRHFKGRKGAQVPDVKFMMRWL